MCISDDCRYFRYRARKSKRSIISILIICLFLLATYVEYSPKLLSFKGLKIHAVDFKREQLKVVDEVDACHKKETSTLIDYISTCRDTDMSDLN
jgi:hypothetical protein